MAKFAPYYKSHKDHGFVEPLIWFTPALGITQITKGNTGKTSKKDIFYFGAMGWDIEDKYIHYQQNTAKNEKGDLKVWKEFLDLMPYYSGFSKTPATAVDYYEMQTD